MIVSNSYNGLPSYNNSAIPTQWAKNLTSIVDQQTQAANLAKLMPKVTTPAQALAAAPKPAAAPAAPAASAGFWKPGMPGGNTSGLPGVPELMNPPAAPAAPAAPTGGPAPYDPVAHINADAIAHGLPTLTQEQAFQVIQDENWKAARSQVVKPVEPEKLSDGMLEAYSNYLEGQGDHGAATAEMKARVDALMEKLRAKSTYVPPNFNDAGIGAITPGFPGISNMAGYPSTLRM